MPAMTPQDQQMLQKVVMAGQKIMYDKSVFPKFAEALAQPAPLPMKLATEAAGLLKMIQDKAQGQIPKRLMIPIGMMLLLEMGDFMEKSKLAKPTERDIQNAMKLLIDIVVKMDKGKPGAKPPQQPGAQPPGAQAAPPQAQPPMPPQGMINQQPQMAGA